MSARPALTVLAFALVLSSCGDVPLGRDLPDCESVSNSLVLSVEAIRDAEYVPCISGLLTGWSYVDLVAKSGESVFWLDSDRMGMHFLEVRLEPSCAIGSARQVPSDEEGVSLYIDVEASTDLTVTVVPEGITLDTFEYANDLAADLREEETINGRNLTVRVDTGPVETGRRIERALGAGDVVFDVGLRNAEEGTVTVILPDDREETRDLALDEAIDLLEEATKPPSYRGVWYYPFEGGCVTYRFDAKGPGVDTVATDVQAALGLWPTEVIRRFARDAGYRLP